MVVKDSSEWIRGAVECVRALIGGCRGLGEGGKAEAVKAAMRVILEAVAGVSRFHDRDALGRQQAARFAFFAALVPAGGRVWNLARRGADRDANFEPLARKMTGVRRSHLMHPMTQGFILSDSQKESALKG